MQRWMTIAGGGMLSRETVHEQLTEMIPYLRRHDNTSRVCSESGMDALLDQLIEIQLQEEFDNCFGDYDGR